MCDPPTPEQQAVAQAELQRVNAQILEVNRQIAAQPRLIAEAVDAAQQQARTRRRVCATCARHPAVVGSLYCQRHQPPKYLR